MAALWTPTPASAERSDLGRYLRWLAERGRRFDGYADLWAWSTEDLEGFWQSIWDYYEVQASAGAERVLDSRKMPGAEWFPGARLNYAEHLLRRGADEDDAVVGVDETGAERTLSWAELRREAAALAAFLRDAGVRPGDRVAAYLPNVPESVVALAAAASVGAVWSVCAPDLGVAGVLGRFGQIEPTVLFVADGYRFGGEWYDRRAEVAEIVAALPSVQRVVWVPQAGSPAAGPPVPDAVPWKAATAGEHEPRFEQVPFDHPLWILYSSGTTGAPKGIVQGHGGILLEHLKYLGLHADLGPGDRYLFVSSTNWMVWNFLVSGLLLGATVVLHDGHPSYPDPSALWKIAARLRVTALGVGAAFLHSCARRDLHPAAIADLGALRTLTSTGSPLALDAYRWVYERVSDSIWLISASGGTDICSAFVGGCPLLPVEAGRLQASCLGARVESWDEQGQALVGAVGELVVTEPMPSMPVRFWNDPDGSRYRESYFDMYPGVWRHGDFIEIAADGSSAIHGRSDSTLNRLGIRIGTADIYGVVEQLPEVEEALVVGAELADGRYAMPLFVVLAAGVELDDALRARIAGAIEAALTPRHVPDTIVAAPGVPHTRTGKKLEVPIKRLLQGAVLEQVVGADAVDDPSVLDFYVRFAAERGVSPGSSPRP